MISTALRMDGHLSQASFRVLLSALARPGRLHLLPRPADGPSVVALALGDYDTPVAVIGDQAQRDGVAFATGAPVVELDRAGLVAFWRSPTTDEIAELSAGSALVPEQGAKVGLSCAALTAEAHESQSGATTVQLSGPGVKDTISFSVSGISPEVFIALAERNSQFPAGVDCWLVDPLGNVITIPRSSRIEVH